MLSSLTANGAQITTDALLEGAFDFIHKPSATDATANRQSLLSELTEKIAAFRLTPVLPPGKWSRHTIAAPGMLDAAFFAPRLRGRYDRRSAMHSSLARRPAARSALSELFPTLPGDFPVPILIVQHMPPQYTHSLANRLNERSQIEVVEGAEGMAVAAGFAYMAPGG